MPRIPVIRIDSINPALLSINLNELSARYLNRWTATDINGIPFMDGCKIISMSSRASVLMKLRERLAPIIIPGRVSLSLGDHGFRTLVYNPNVSNNIESQVLRCAQIDGIAVRLGQLQEPTWNQRRGYLPILFEEPYELPLVNVPWTDTTAGADYQVRRILRKRYQTHINNCCLAANTILEEKIRIGTISIGLIADLLHLDHVDTNADR